MLHPTIKTIAKKVCSKGKGLFQITHLSNTAISFRNSMGNVFSFQLTNCPVKGCGEFKAGHVHKYTKLAPTFESEYQKYGNIKCALFIPYHESNTDNPDYILRNSIHFTLN